MKNYRFEAHLGFSKYSILDKQFINIRGVLFQSNGFVKDVVRPSRRLKQMVEEIQIKESVMDRSQSGEWK